jgi:glycosyltransferase involved in cell wall biosynthesis
MKPVVTLSMIVRDAARDLPACLHSVRRAVDAMVIADTGSTDATVSIAHSFGARVIHVPWRDDFAEARNLAMLPITEGWVLSLDADEHLDPAAGASLPLLIRNHAASGYLVPIRNYVASVQERLWDRPATPNPGDYAPAKAFPALIEHEKVRLFRREPGIYFTGRVHETTGKRIEAMGGRLARAPFCLHHFGLAADTETRARKNHLYRHLGRKKLEDMPDDAQAHFELGLVEFDDFHNLELAEQLFARAARLDRNLGVASFFLGLCQLRRGNCAGALQSLQQALERGHVTPLVYETLGDAHYNARAFEEARRDYQRAIRAGAGAETVSKLGLAEVRSHLASAGLAHLREAIGQSSGVADSHDRLTLALVWLGRLDEAAEAALARAAAFPAPEAFLRAASIFSKLGDWGRAHTALQSGRQQFPEAGNLQAAEGEVLEKVGLSGMGGELSGRALPQSETCY